jgi:RNA polymerase sigma-70 factor (ECF subfamily)
MPLNAALVNRLYHRARAERWGLPIRVLADALEASVHRAFSGRVPASRELEPYLDSLHLEDLAVACACALGSEAAWEAFVRDHRPVLYRAADALDPSGGAREVADSLYAELFGLQERGGERQSLFRYFHGRSSLATWLRVILAQRHVDRMRIARRLTALADDDPTAGGQVADPPDPDRPRYVELIRRALEHVVSRLAAADRLRLSCYYAQEMTLAQIGRLLGEHEATVSRHLARTRRAIRKDVEHRLRTTAGLSGSQIAECFASVLEDAGTIDLTDMLEVAGERERKER